VVGSRDLPRPLGIAKGEAIVDPRASTVSRVSAPINMRTHQYASGTPEMSRIALKAFAGPLSPISIPVSLRYVGTALEIQPIAKPVHSRTTISCETLYELAWITEPMIATIW